MGASTVIGPGHAPDVAVDAPGSASSDRIPGPWSRAGRDGDGTERVYARATNSTRDAFEEAGWVEGGEVHAFASGVAAVAGVLSLATLGTVVVGYVVAALTCAVVSAVGFGRRDLRAG